MEKGRPTCTRRTSQCMKTWSDGSWAADEDNSLRTEGWMDPAIHGSWWVRTGCCVWTLSNGRTWSPLSAVNCLTTDQHPMPIEGKTIRSFNGFTCSVSFFVSGRLHQVLLCLPPSVFMTLPEFLYIYDAVASCVCLSIWPTIICCCLSVCV